MNVGKVCSRRVIAVSASAPASEAARLMCEEGVGAVVVTAAPANRAVAIGMVTDRDIVCAQLDRTADLGQLRTGDLMSADPLVLNEEAPIEEAIRRLRDRQVRRAPVVDSTGELIGVISFDDLLSHVSGDLRALSQLAESRTRPRAGYAGTARQQAPAT